MDDDEYQHADLDAWAGACEILRCCFVPNRDKNQLALLEHVEAILDELIYKHGAAAAQALLVGLVDLAGGLLLTAGNVSGHTPEAVLDLMQLLVYEEDDEDI